MILCIHPEVLRPRPHGCDSTHRCASVVTFPQMQMPATALMGIYVASVGIFLLFTGLTDLSLLKKKKTLCFPNRRLRRSNVPRTRPGPCLVSPWSLPGVAAGAAWESASLPARQLLVFCRAVFTSISSILVNDGTPQADGQQRISCWP